MLVKVDEFVGPYSTEYWCYFDDGVKCIEHKINGKIIEFKKIAKSETVSISPCYHTRYTRVDSEKSALTACEYVLTCEVVDAFKEAIMNEVATECAETSGIWFKRKIEEIAKRLKEVK